MNTGGATARPFPGPLGALLITMAASFTAVLVASLFGRRPDFGAIGIGQVVGFGMVAILATQRIPPPQSERVGLQGFAIQFLPLLVFLLPAVVLTSEVDNWIRVWLPIQEISEATPDAVEEAPALYQQVQRAIVVIGLAPVMEEWLFRGVILQGLVGNLGRIPGIALTSMLFAMGHIGPGPGSSIVLSYFMVAFLTGVTLSIVRLATGSLLAAMLVHASLNLISLGADSLANTIPITGFNAEGPHTPVSVLVPCAFVVWFALQRLWRVLLERPLTLSLPEEGDAG